LYVVFYAMLTSRKGVFDTLVLTGKGVNMPLLLKHIRLWMSQDDGATAVEYGLIVAGIALAVSVAVFTVGGNIVDLLDNLTSFLES